MLKIRRELFDSFANQPHPGPAQSAMKVSRAERAVVIAWRLLLQMEGEPILVRDLFATGEIGDAKAWGDSAGAATGGLGLEREKGKLLRTRPNFVRCAHALRKAGKATATVAKFLGLAEGDDLVSALCEKGESLRALAAPVGAPEEPADAEIIEAEATSDK